MGGLAQPYPRDGQKHYTTSVVQLKTFQLKYNIQDERIVIEMRELITDDEL